MSKKIKYHKKWYVIHVMEGERCIDKIKIDGDSIKPISDMVDFVMVDVNRHLVSVSKELEDFLKNR